MRQSVSESESQRSVSQSDSQSVSQSAGVSQSGSQPDGAVSQSGGLDRSFLHVNVKNKNNIVVTLNTENSILLLTIS